MKQIAVLCVLGCISCGGGGADTPVQKCEALINDVCDRGVECIPQEVGTHADCVQTLDQVLACASAKQIGSTYDRCIQQIKADSCPTLFPADPQTNQHSFALPTDCMAVILKLQPGNQPGSALFQHAGQLSAVSAE